MQDADERRYSQKPRICFDEHPLDFIHLGSCTRSLLLRGFVKAVGHGRKHLEFKIWHRLKRDLEGKSAGSCIDLNVLWFENPEFVWKNNRFVEAMRAGLVSMPVHKVNIWFDSW
jgi:hypothetical protein